MLRIRRPAGNWRLRDMKSEGLQTREFHARDPAYLDAVYPNFDASYHNYRDSSIHNYLPEVEELTRRGYYAIRMGAVVKEALNVLNGRVVDYATGGKRTDFHPNATMPAYRVACNCRKPRPGLLLRASIEHRVKGQHLSPPIETVDPLDSSVLPDHVCADFTAAVGWILEAM